MPSRSSRSFRNSVANMIMSRPLDTLLEFRVWWQQLKARIDKARTAQHTVELTQVLNFDDLPANEPCSTIWRILRSHPNPPDVEMIQLQRRITLVYLPLEIGYFKNVRTLILCHTALTELPWSMVYMTELSVLDVSYNMFRTFPMLIIYFKKLRNLNISGNELITGIPDSLIQLENLETLEMDGLPKLPEDILALEGQGVNVIFEKLKSRNRQNNLWDKTRQVDTLMQMSMKTLIKCGVDFENLEILPNLMKRFIRNADEDYSRSVKLAKCSRCNEFFSTRASFVEHVC